MPRPASLLLLEGMAEVEDMAVSGVTPESELILALGVIRGSAVIPAAIRASLVIRATHAFSEARAVLS